MFYYIDVFLFKKASVKLCGIRCFIMVRHEPHNNHFLKNIWKTFSGVPISFIIILRPSRIMALNSTVFLKQLSYIIINNVMYAIKKYNELFLLLVVFLRLLVYGNLQRFTFYFLTCWNINKWYARFVTIYDFRNTGLSTIIK